MENILKLWFKENRRKRMKKRRHENSELKEVEQVYTAINNRKAYLSTDKGMDKKLIVRIERLAGTIAMIIDSSTIAITKSLNRDANFV